MTVILWIVFSFVVGVVAVARGRSPAGYFVLSTVLSPLVGLLVLAALPPLTYMDARGIRRRAVTEREWLAAHDPRYARRQRYWEAIIAACVLAAIFVAMVHYAVGTAHSAVPGTDLHFHSKVELIVGWSAVALLGLGPWLLARWRR